MMKYVAVCLVLVLMISTCSSTVKDNSLSPQLQGEDMRLFLVDQARWSMSAHNMQPWDIVLDKANPQSFMIYLANDRLLTATDRFSRQIVMSIGGFLSLLEDAAAAQGYTTRIDLFPEGELPGDDIGASFTRPIAEVRIEQTNAPVESEYLDAVSSATVKANLGAAA